MDPLASSTIITVPQLQLSTKMKDQNFGLPNEILLQIMNSHQENDSKVYNGFRYRQAGCANEEGIRNSNHIYRQLCQMTRKMVLPKIWQSIYLGGQDDMEKLLKCVYLTTNIDFYLQYLENLNWTPIDDLFEDVDPTIFLDLAPDLEWYEVAKPALLKFFENCKSLKSLRWELNRSNPLPLEISNILQSHKSLQTIHLSCNFQGGDFVYSSIPLGWITLEIEHMALSIYSLTPSDERQWMIEQFEESYMVASIDPEEPFGLIILQHYERFMSLRTFCGVIQGEHSGYERFPSWIMANILENLENLLENAKPVVENEQKKKDRWKPLAKVIFDFAEVMYLTPYLPVFLFGVELSSVQDSDISVVTCIDAIQSVQKNLLNVFTSVNLENEKETDLAIIAMCKTTLREMYSLRSESDQKHKFLIGRPIGAWPNFDEPLDKIEHIKQILDVLQKSEDLRASAVKAFKTLEEFCLVYEEESKDTEN